MHAVALASPTACVTTAGWKRRRRLNGYIHIYVYINSYRYNIILARLIHAFQLHSHHSPSFSHVEFVSLGIHRGSTRWMPWKLAQTAERLARFGYAAELRGSVVPLATLLAQSCSGKVAVQFLGFAVF